MIIAGNKSFNPAVITIFNPPSSQDRITEDGQTRITEDGQIRETE